MDNPPRQGVKISPFHQAACLESSLSAWISLNPLHRVISLSWVQALSHILEAAVQLHLWRTQHDITISRHLSIGKDRQYSKSIDKTESFFFVQPDKWCNLSTDRGEKKVSFQMRTMKAKEKIYWCFQSLLFSNSADRPKGNRALNWQKNKRVFSWSLKGCQHPLSISQLSWECDAFRFWETWHVQNMFKMLSGLYID